MIHSMTATWTPPATFGSRLRDAREDLGLTIEEAAAKCGLSRSTWTTWENGAKPRDMATVVEKISRGLSVEGRMLDPMWLLWGRSADGGDGDTQGMQPTVAKVAKQRMMGTRATHTSTGTSARALQPTAA